MKVLRSRTPHLHHDHFMDEADSVADDHQADLDDSDLQVPSRQILISLTRAALHEVHHLLRTLHEQDHRHMLLELDRHRTLHEQDHLRMLQGPVDHHMLHEPAARLHTRLEAEVHHTVHDQALLAADRSSLDLSRPILQRLRLWAMVIGECSERELDNLIKESGGALRTPPLFVDKIEFESSLSPRTVSMKRTRKIYAVIADPNIHRGDSRSVQCMTTNPRIAILAARVIANRDTSKGYDHLSVVWGADGDLCGAHTRLYKGLYRSRRVRSDPHGGWLESFEGEFGRYEPFIPCEGKTKANKGKFRLVIGGSGSGYRFSQDLSWERILSILCFVDRYTIYNDKNEVVDIMTGKKREMAA